ncbi:MAG: hypothetical protein ACREJ2_10695, partial [Planctomycetota bacterium]
ASPPTPGATASAASAASAGTPSSSAAAPTLTAAAAPAGLSPPPPAATAPAAFEYVFLRSERTDHLDPDGNLTREENRWIYLRTRRAVKSFQRIAWPAPADGLPQRVEVRRFRPGVDPLTGALDEELAGVTLAAPGGQGGVVTWVEDLRPGDVLQVRTIESAAASRVEAADYGAQIGFGGRIPCLTESFTLIYPAAREALWKSTGADLDFTNSLDNTYRTATLNWTRNWHANDPHATARLRVSIQAPRLTALDWLRRRTGSDIACGPDLLGYVAREQRQLAGQPGLSEATARAFYTFVRSDIHEDDPAQPLCRLHVGSSADCFSRRHGNRWEKCQLLARLLRLAGLEAYVYAVRTDSTESPDPHKLLPVLPQDFDDCIVGWHRPFDSIVWLYPQGAAAQDFGQFPAALGDHPAVRLNPRGPVVIETLPHETPVTLFPGEGAP